MSEMQFLQEAFKCHQSGDLQGAERLYQKTLQFNPKNAQALHLYGILAQQVNQLSAAEKLVKDAISIAPKNHEFFNTYGIILKSQNKREEALKSFRQAIALNQNYEDARMNYGVLLLENDQASEALLQFRKWVKLNPHNPQAHYHLALACSRDGKENEAIKTYEKALKLKPDFENACLNLCLLYKRSRGISSAIEEAKKFIAKTPSTKIYKLIANLYQQSASWESALSYYYKVQKSGESTVDLFLNIGTCLTQIGDKKGAENTLKSTTSQFPESFEAHYNLGTLYLERKEYDLAVESLEVAWGLEKNSQVLQNLGNAYTKTHQYEKAEDIFHLQIQQDPKNINTLYSLAIVKHEQLELDAAINYLNQVLEIDPNHADAHSSIGFIELQRENYKIGWREYEWRWKSPGFTSKVREFPFPHWSGESLHGKKIFIASEQGYGDVLQFLRFVPLLKKMGASEVIVEVQDILLPLVQLHPGVDEWIVKGDLIPNCDYYCHLMSLAGLLGVESSDLPGVSEIKLNHLEEPRLPIVSSGKKIGIVWAGNPEQVNDHNRSMCLEQLSPLIDVANLNIYSFQIGKRESDLQSISWGDRITNLAPIINNYKDSAVLAKQMDLIITVCTSMAHLAGFLNIPCWTLLCYNSDWRWGLHREQSLWYPKTRLFRQPKAGDWDSVILEVTNELQK